jgi:DNA polymerase III subunit gamma/tau
MGYNRARQAYYLVSTGRGRGIRTREGLPPTRFPSVRPRPLGESSAEKLTGRGTWKVQPSDGGNGRERCLGWLDLLTDPPCGVYLANPPRAGRQQGYAGSDGCAGGPFPVPVKAIGLAGEDDVMAEDSEVTRTTPTRTTQSLALYRKYRPATFAEVRGQDHVTEPLRQALRSGRINHAYLFSGPRGCGKTSSARILARSLNCVQGPTPDPCGVCDSCVALAPSGAGSIDVIEIDAASHGGVDDARDLRERAFYAPVAGRYKIYIIDEAHMVTQQGFNALLKLVEEPPPHLKFIFATTEPEKVIPTIRSRTHHYPFRLMPPSVMRDLTEEILNSEGVPFDPAVLPLVVRAGGGSARDSLSILDQLLAGSDEAGIRYDRAVSLLGYTDASLLDEIVDAFAAGDGAGVFRAVNRVIEGGHEPRRFATDMLDRFRDLIVLASVPDAIVTGLLDTPPDRVEALTGQAGRYGLAALTRAADIVSTGLDQMRGATSPRLLLELMCAQVLLPGAATDERSVLARLERLEAGAAALPAQVRAPAAASNAHSERTVVASGPHAPAAPGGHVEAAPPSPRSAPAAPAGGQAAPPADSAPVVQPAPQLTQPETAPAPASASQVQVPASATHQSPEAVAPPTASASPASSPRGGVTTEALIQAWPHVLDAVKAKGRVAAIVIGNASLVSLDEAVLTLRFPRQGDVKGFVNSKYEDLLKQVINTMFGINVVVRAVTGGGDAPAARRPGPGPAAPPAPPPPVPAPAEPAQPAGMGGSRPPSPLGRSAPPESAGPSAGYPAEPSGPASGSTGGAGSATGPFGSNGFPSGDLPPLPPPPSPDDEEFDPDDEDMSVSVPNELTGMALVQRELGGQVIAEYDE